MVRRTSFVLLVSIFLCCEAIDTSKPWKVLRGNADKERDSATLGDTDDKWAAVEEWATGFGETGDKFVSSLRQFDETSSRMVENTSDEKAKLALQEAQKAYDAQIASWSKMKAEWGASNQVKIDAMSASTSGILKTIDAISNGDGVTAVSGIFDTAGAFASVIPGGQGFGLVFGLFGMVLGLFSPAGGVQASLTIDDIKNAVKEVVDKALKEFGAEVAKVALLDKCVDVESDLQSIWIDMTSLWQAEIAGTIDDDTAKNEINNVVGSIKSQITKVAQIFAELEVDMEENVIISSNAGQRKCVDTCALMTVPLDKWKENPSNPDLGFMGAPDWAPCPDSHDFDDQMNIFAYKLCIKHDTSDPKAMFTPVYPFCDFNDGCKNRVGAINGCRDDFHQAQKDFASVVQVVGCAARQTISIRSMMQTLRMLGARSGNFPFLPVSFSYMMNNLDAQYQRLGFLTMYRSPELALTFTFNDKTFSCKDQGWLEDMFSYKNGILQNAPCSTDNWVSFMSGVDTVYKQDNFKCSVVNPNNQDPDWGQVGPTFNYDAMRAAQWDNTQQIF